MTVTLPQTMQIEIIEGVVDGLTGSVLRGWAWLPEMAQTPVTIEVRANGTLLAAGLADVLRTDLLHAGKRDGHCAFELALDPLPPAGTMLDITAIGKSSNQTLEGSPVTVSTPPPSPPRAAEVDIFPIPLTGPNLIGSLDQCGPDRIRGWLRWTDDTCTSPALLLREGAHEWLRFDANQWRSDLAELHQGDGCCGFDQSLPTELCDGQMHALELCLSEYESTPLSGAVRTVTSSVSNEDQPARSKSPSPFTREAGSSTITLSIIVNFYNMQREAARTLASLARSYQTGCEELDYEVLCVDNGSEPPLDSAWVTSFGPEFRLIRPSQQHASPCAAMNEAALQARGKYLAVMIDGAHVLTPGIFKQARQAWQQDAEAVVAVRHWFVGGDQRWLAMAGYSREQEDRLFARIRWPQNGYELFRIGTPIGESPEPWFDGLSESNCLILPTALYDRIGGFDEAFSQAGGGFANLDLWHRASESAHGPLVSLVGEATFHQFHDGTTTNVDDAEKDRRVRGYANAYRSLRGVDFAGVHRSRLSFQGSMPSEFATGVRQRPLLPMRLGVSDSVRRGQIATQFDEGAQTYLQSVYAECGLHESVQWLGLPVGVAPADLNNVQEIVYQLRPDAIVTIGAKVGLVTFIDDCLKATNNLDARILNVEPGAASMTLSSTRITSLSGNPADPGTLATARHWTGSAETVLVLYATGSDTGFSVEGLEAWGTLVSYRSWLICLGTLFGQPWLGYSIHEHLQTVRDFTRIDSSFSIDRHWNSQLISTCPSGYLRRVGGLVTAANYDATLDTIPSPLQHPETLG